MTAPAFSPADVFKIIKTIGTKRWQVRGVHGHEGHRWCWLVNVDNRADQCRFSLKAWSEL